MLQLSAPAKINLTLKVTGRLADGPHAGYHEIESLVAFADIGDRLFIKKAAVTSLEANGPFANALAGDNLVAAAHAALETQTGKSLPTHMLLEKNLPVAAGLGGGSADAAAALRGLAQLHELDAPLFDIAATLGADVPVCLHAAPYFMSGIGHQLHTLSDLPACDIVLVNPRLPLATAKVFKALAETGDYSVTAPPPTGFADAKTLLAYMQQQGNDLEGVACGLVPEIGACLDALKASGVAHAAMSGSGASCFGLCAPGSGKALAARYRTIREKDWVVSGRLMGAA